MDTATNSAPPAALRLLAVDDERPALDELTYLLNAEASVASVASAGDSTTALRLLRDGDFDAVFLDIDMPGLDGLELAGVLGHFASPPAVVFVTAHDDRAVAAFEIGAVDYLLKPLRSSRLAESVARVVARRAPAATEPEPAEDVIPVELGGVTTLVPRGSVAWVEAEGDYARLHTANGRHLVRIPLSTLETRWSRHGFIRVHRSYLVSRAVITGIRTVGSAMVVCVRESGGAPAVELPVSRRHARDLREKLVRAPRRVGP